MLCIQTPKSEANLVCQCVSVSVSGSLWGRDDTWQISESRQVDWVLVFSSCSVGHFFERVVVVYWIAAVFLVLGKFWRAFRRRLMVLVQGKLCPISKLLFRAVYDWLSFISKINCTALPCLLFVILFKFCWLELPWRYRSCLLTHGNISRLALCLVRIELKLRRFRKPTFIDFKILSGAGCMYHEYLTSQYLSVWTIGVGYISNWKSYCTLKNTHIK